MVFASSRDLARNPERGLCLAAWVLASLAYDILHAVDCVIFAVSRALARNPERGACLAAWVHASPVHDILHAVGCM
eukprot:6619249-Prymnesium_polylepis.1